MIYTTFESPLGELLLVNDGKALSGLHMREGRRPVAVEPGWRRAAEPFAAVRAQLREYFDGERESFDIRLSPAGPQFFLRVWDELRQVPYGATISYGELARRVGRPSAARAVGAANGRNPISVIVPCHRVVGADGGLTGYGGGMERKRRLLELESGVLALG